MKRTQRQNGYLNLFRTGDSTTGSLMRKTGVSPEIDTGAIQFQFGLQKMVRKLFALVQSKNLKLCREYKVSKIYIENSWIISLSPRNKVKEFSEEFQRSLIAGLNQEQCRSLRATTHSRLMTRSL